jgi:LPS-assembly lipoprotein
MKFVLARPLFSTSRVASLALCALLTACGFHLRGEAELPFETLYISSNASSLVFANKLKRAVRSGSQTKIVEDVKSAQATLSVLDAHRERVILSLSTSGRIQELSLYYHVSFAVADSSGKQYLSPNQIVLRRDLTYNDTDIIAKEQEEELLYLDMENDAVQQVMRRLQAARARP